METNNQNLLPVPEAPEENNQSQKFANNKKFIAIGIMAFLFIIIFIVGIFFFRSIREVEKKKSKNLDSSASNEPILHGGFMGSKTINGVKAEFSIDLLEGNQDICDSGIKYGRSTIETGHEIFACVKTASCCDKINNMDFDEKSDNNINNLLLKYNHEINEKCNCPGRYIRLLYRITNLPEGELVFKVTENQLDARTEDNEKPEITEEAKFKRMFDISCAAVKIWADETDPQTDNHKQFALDTAKPVMEKYNISYEQFLEEWHEQEILFSRDPKLHKKLQEHISSECR